MAGSKRTVCDNCRDKLFEEMTSREAAMKEHLKIIGDCLVEIRKLLETILESKRS